MQVCPMRFDQQIIRERILWITYLSTSKFIVFCLPLFLYFYIWIYSKKRVYPLRRITNDYSFCYQYYFYLLYLFLHYNQVFQCLQLTIGLILINV